MKKLTMIGIAYMLLFSSLSLWAQPREAAEALISRVLPERSSGT